MRNKLRRWRLRLPVRQRIILNFGLIGLLVAVFAGSLSGVVGYRERTDLYESYSRTLVAATAARLDAELLDAIVSEADRQTRRYRQLEYILTAMAADWQSLASVGVYRPTAAPNLFDVVSHVPQDSAAERLQIGARLTVPGDELARISAGPVSIRRAGSHWRTWSYAVYAPVHDRFGDLVAVVGAEFNDAAVLKIRNSLMRVVSVGLAVFSVLWLGVVSLISRLYGKPIGGMYAAIRAREDGDTEMRVPVPRQRELARIAQTLNGLFDAVPDWSGSVLARFGEVRAGERIVTVLAADFIGFSHVKAHITPAEKLALLGVCARRIGQLAAIHNGAVFGSFSDRIYAVFGVREGDKSHAADAVAAALDMQDALAVLRVELEIPDLRLGMGIDTGSALVGSSAAAFGGQFMNVVGRVIGRAHDLEAAARVHGAGVYVTSETRAALDNEFDLQPLDGVTIVRRGEVLSPFRVLGRKLAPAGG